MYSRNIRISLPLLFAFVLLALIVSLLPHPLTHAEPNYDCNTATGLSPAECEGLVALYNATDGPNWSTQTDWLVTNTPCSWYGVTCSSGHATTLSLANNRLTGSAPPEIGNLTSLTYLGLSGNQLTAVPPEIGNLTSLTTLSLSGNQLTAVPSEIWNLTSLTSLDLSDNQLTAVPPEIGNLTSLTFLGLSNNQLTAVPPEIGDLTSLTTLYLWDNQLTTVPPEIGNLTSLTILYLWDNQLTTVPPEIGSLTNLTRLSLIGNQLTAVPPEIGSLTSLTRLSLSDNQLTAVPPEMGNLTSLAALFLFSNPLTGSIPVTLTNLTNLSYFWFYDTDWCVPDTPTFTNWLAAIGDVQGTGLVCGQAPGAISGVVSPTAPTADVQAVLYRYAGWQWMQVDTTAVDSSGHYLFDNLGQGIEYRVRFADASGVYAPEYYDDAGHIDTAAPVTATLGVTRTGIDAVLALPQPPLIDVDAGSGSSSANPLDGSVTVNVTPGNRSDITVTRTVTCTGGITPSLVALQLETNAATITYTTSSTGNGRYRATIPAADITGDATLNIKTTCGGVDETTTVGYVNLYDPSGSVTDAITNQPVANALITLYQVPGWRPRTNPGDTAVNTCESNDSKAAGAPWSQPAPVNEGVIVNTDITTVAPLLSHQRTDADGHYGWDVPQGCWYVVVRADGYNTLTSPVVGIPPEVTDLNLALTPAGFAIYLPLIVR